MRLKINNLSFSYSKKNILNDISFSAESGDFIALLGPNGAGKSTLFKCILGFNRTYKGEILINDININKYSIKEMAINIAFVPQHSIPTFNYTVFDTVLMGVTNCIPVLSQPKSCDIEKVNNILKRIGIYHLKDVGCEQISGGERQLTMIGRALAQNAKILLLDEPTASLDFGNQYKVLNIISSLAIDGYTIIMSTHDPNQAFSYANKTLSIKDGEIIAFGETNKVLTSDLLSYMYNTPIERHDIESSNGKGITICVSNVKKRPTMSQWTDKMIKYMIDASLYGNYHKNLAKFTSRFIGHNESVLDVGCGLCFLSNELTNYTNNITAIDINKYAIRSTDRYVNKTIKIIEGDVHNYEFNTKFDVLIFNYFGRIDDIISIAKRICKSRIIIITRNTDKPGFSLDDKSIRSHHRPLFKYLDDNEINYEKIETEIEFGQPFEDIQNAIEFFEIYKSKESKSIKFCDIDHKINKISDDKFSYYYPYKKRIVIIKIEMEELL